MKLWRLTITSPQLGRLEREIPEYALLSNAMSPMFDSVKAIKLAGLPVELTFSFQPLDSTGGTVATEGGPHKAS